VKDGKLDTVIETDNIQQTDDGVTSDRDIDLDGSEPVSMNMWGFTPILFDHLRDMFVDFLKENEQEMKSEFLIPSVVNELIQSGKKNVHVLRSGAKWFGVTYKEDRPFKWFGVTYKEDRPFVVGEIQKLIDSGVYPEKLF